MCAVKTFFCCCCTFRSSSTAADTAAFSTFSSAGDAPIRLPLNDAVESDRVRLQIVTQKLLKALVGRTFECHSGVVEPVASPE